MSQCGGGGGAVGAAAAQMLKRDDIQVRSLVTSSAFCLVVPVALRWKLEEKGMGVDGSKEVLIDRPEKASRGSTGTGRSRSSGSD